MLLTKSPTDESELQAQLAECERQGLKDASNVDVVLSFTVRFVDVLTYSAHLLAVVTVTSHGTCVLSMHFMLCAVSDCWAVLRVQI